VSKSLSVIVSDDDEDDQTFAFWSNLKGREVTEALESLNEFLGNPDTILIPKTPQPKGQ
jgi:hypothetical protein